MNQLKTIFKINLMLPRISGSSSIFASLESSFNGPEVLSPEVFDVTKTCCKRKKWDMKIRGFYSEIWLYNFTHFSASSWSWRVDNNCRGFGNWRCWGWCCCNCCRRRFMCLQNTYNSTRSLLSITQNGSIHSWFSFNNGCCCGSSCGSWFYKIDNK